METQLNVSLCYPKGKRRVSGRGYEQETIIIVKFGPITLASAKVGGRYNEKQALSEWEKNPRRFKLTKDGEGFLNPIAVEDI